MIPESFTKESLQSYLWTMSDAHPAITPTPEQLRGISHPLRMRILGRLRLDGPQTATDLAAALGVNTGQTSYHLRQLAQYGFIAESTGMGTGRERYWHALHQSTRTRSSTLDPDTSAAFRQAAVVNQLQWVQAAVQEHAELPAPWREAGTNSDWWIRLTPEQAHELVARIGAVVDEALAAEPPAGQEPDGAELFMVQLHAFPRPGGLAHRDEPGDKSDADPSDEARSATGTHQSSTHRSDREPS